MKLLTTDIYEGAYFMSQGMELESLWLNGKNGKNGKRNVVFQFVGPQVELLRKKYQKGRAEANVIGLKQSLNELKDRMFNLMRTPNLPRATSLRGTQAHAGQEERRTNHEWKQFTVR